VFFKVSASRFEGSAKQRFGKDFLPDPHRRFGEGYLRQRSGASDGNGSGVPGSNPSSTRCSAGNRCDPRMRRS